MFSETILIQSGEGLVGRFELYTGKKTLKGIKTRITKERCGGDRWATAWIEMIGDYKSNTYKNMFSEEIREIII